MNVADGLKIPLAPVDAARVIAARHAERGRWWHALRRVWRYATHETHRVTITVDGEPRTHRVMQVLVLNSPYYGWSLPLLPEASMEDGILDVAALPRMGRFALIVALVALMRGTAIPQRPVRYRGAHIGMSSAEPITVHADGKVVGTLPAEFECRRGVLRVFGP